MTSSPLDTAAVAAVDSTGQAGEVLDLSAHLLDALWRVDSAALRPAETGPGQLIVAGMGGSGIGGRLALAALGPRAVHPVAVAAGYVLPSWAGVGSTVLCSSYSGATEETLSCYDQAGTVGARRIVATTGGPLAERARADGVPVIPLPAGFQPRAAVGYSTVVALAVAALAGAGPSLRPEIEAAAALAGRLAEEWGPAAPEDAEPKRLARALHGSVPVVAGAELTEAVAYRWKCQFNENAKLPSFASALPELDHNEVVGWKAAPSLGTHSMVFLDDPDTHPRTRTRIGLTAELIGAGASAIEVVEGRGSTRMERLVSLVLLGDLLSIYLAVLRGADPAEIDVLHALKGRLSAG